MLFSEIKGYENIKKRLYNTIKMGRVSHAQLFLGDDSTPKLSFAIAYAQLLNCENSNGLEACGVCNSCKKYNKLIHPDLHFIFPVIKTPKISKPISRDFLDKWRDFVLSTKYHSYNDWIETLETANLQASIYAQESQEIIRIVNLKTFEAKYKVLIIYMPEKMNIVAANKLLKVIEEPPENTLFILVAENEELILNTIRSRTQLVKINKISDETLFEILKEEYSDLDDDLIWDAIYAAEGNYAIAKKNILEFIDSQSDTINKNFDLFVNFMRLAFASPMLKIVNFVDEITALSKEAKRTFLDYSLKMLRNNFVWNITENEKIVHLSKKEKDFSKNFRKFISQKNIFALEKEFSKAIFDLERNGNDKLIFLDLILKTHFLLKQK